MDKHDRETDMINRVLAVAASVDSKSPLNLFDNGMMRAYLERLDPKHRPPHRLQRNRIVECMIDYVLLELSKIIKERRDLLGDQFISGTIDFWTDPHRRKQYGAFVIDILANKYLLRNGSWKFISNETLGGLSSEILLSKNGKLENLEAVMNFEEFGKAKTCTNVSEWMRQSNEAINICPSDYIQCSADGEFVSLLGKNLMYWFLGDVSVGSDSVGSHLVGSSIFGINGLSF